MEFYRTETTVGPGGTVSVDHVPIDPGKTVSVSIEEIESTDTAERLKRARAYATKFASLVEGLSQPSLESLRRENLYEN